jgi:hypothetical protein
MENGDEAFNMANSMASFHALLSKFDIPTESLDVNINEYAVYGEQVPSGGAWWIAGLERENAHGLRGNWAMAGALHDFLAGMLPFRILSTEILTNRRTPQQTKRRYR